MSEKFKIVIFTTLVTLFSSSVGYWISSEQYAKDLAFRQKSFLVERKYDIYTTYMKAVNQSWSQYKHGDVNGELRQRGIDAYEDIRAISTPEVQEKADLLNSYFSKLYSPFVITKEENIKYNDAFNEFKIVANKEFTF